MLNDHTFDAEQYKAHVQQERAERAARVRRFLAEQEESDVADLFDAMRDVIDDREADEVFYLSKFFQQVRGVFDCVEERLCN